MASIVVGFSVIAGLLLILSIWFMAFGFPVVLFSIPAIAGVAMHRRPGAPHPALFLYLLAAVQVGIVTTFFGYAGFPGDAWHVFGPSLAPGLVTTLVAVLVHKTAKRATRP